MQGRKHHDLNEESDIPVGVPVGYVTNQQPPHQNYHHHQAYQLQPNPYQGQMPPPPPPPNMAPQQFAPHQPQINYRFPMNAKCPCCKLDITTSVIDEPGNSTYIWSFVCCCCCGLVCSMIPCFMNKCLDKNHFCPNCGFNILRKHQGCWQFCD